MALRVTLYYSSDSNRSVQIAQAMYSGMRRNSAGERLCLHLRKALSFTKPDSDVAIFYGLHKHILSAYTKRGLPAIYIDLGYWGRHEGGRREGFHKFALNTRHPTAYFQNRKHDSCRFRHFGVPIRDWQNTRKKGYILLAGMSAKAAKAEGFAPEEWERDAVKQIREHTDREIVYRPKPNWRAARQLQGTRMERGVDGDVGRWLEKCHAVVTHHSNVSVDAILAGVPVFCWDGVATAPGKASSDLSQIETPPEAVDREQWAADIAWTQWSVPEMRSGAAWRYLKDEVLSL